MGGELYNLNKLIVQLSGCWEQNIAGFAPALVVHETHNTIVNYAKQDLQKHLNLRIGTGTYVGSDRLFNLNQGSTWLTAFIVKIFRQARTFMTIDVSLKWQSRKAMTAFVKMAQNLPPEENKFQKNFRILNFATCFVLTASFPLFITRYARTRSSFSRINYTNWQTTFATTSSDFFKISMRISKLNFNSS